MDKNILKKYIDDCKKNDISDVIIIKNLTEHGWPIETIMKVLNPVSKPAEINNISNNPVQTFIYASFGRRLAAFLLDIGLLTMISFVLDKMLLIFTSKSSTIYVTIGLITDFVVYILIPVIFLSLKGTTPGKSLLGLYVKKDTGGKLGILKVFFRETFGKLISGLPIFLGFLWIILDAKRQGFHDKIFKTIVVYDQETANRNKNWLKIIAIFLTIMVFTLFGYGVYSMFKFYQELPTIKTTLTNFLANASNQNYDLAYKFTSKEFREKTTEKIFREQISSMKYLLTGFKNQELNSYKYEDNQLSYQGTITYTNGGKGNLTSFLVKENNVWKISGIYITSSVDKIKNQIISAEKSITGNSSPLDMQKTGYENPKFAEATNDTKILYGAGKYSEGLSKAKDSLILAKNDEEKAIAHYWIGLMYYRLNNPDAESELLLATKLNPLYGAPYVTLSSISLSKSNFEQALQFAEKSVALDPTYAWGYNNRGLALISLGRKEEGLKALQKAVELSPDTYIFRDNLTRAQQSK